MNRYTFDDVFSASKRNESIYKNETLAQMIYNAKAEDERESQSKNVIDYIRPYASFQKLTTK